LAGDVFHFVLLSTHVNITYVIARLYGFNQ
jgi:hypothetical protein